SASRTRGSSATRARRSSSPGRASSRTTTRSLRTASSRRRSPNASLSLARALELVDASPRRGYPNPTVGAVVVADGQIVGEGVTEPDGGRHGEVVALDEAGERARGSTIYLTMEPCAHHGKTPPCVDRVLAAGVTRLVAGSLDPNPKAGGGAERLRASGLDVEVVDSFRARQQNEAWRTWGAPPRPVVPYNAAITVDRPVTRPRAPS